jgi:MFS superfamily sulfate permease-like transporter
VVHQLITVTDLVNEELITDHTIDMDDEIYSVGIANLLSGGLGLVPTYVPIGNTLTNFRMVGGSKHARLGSFILSGTFFISIFYAPLVVSCVPRVMVGTFFWWLSINFLRETIVHTAHSKANTSDLIIVLIMAVSMMAIGFMGGLLLGILLACLVFTFLYSQDSVVFSQSDGRFERCNTHRRYLLSSPPPSSSSSSLLSYFLLLPCHRPSFFFPSFPFHSSERRNFYLFLIFFVFGSRDQMSLLETHGEQIQIVHLQGYLMFGSMPQVSSCIDTITNSAADVPVSSTSSRRLGPPKYMLVNFGRCSNIDYSAANDLYKVWQIATSNGYEVILTETSGPCLQVLQNTGVLRQVQQKAFLLKDATDLAYPPPKPFRLIFGQNSALQYCENHLLKYHTSGTDKTASSDVQWLFSNNFSRFVTDLGSMDIIMSHFQETTYKRGEVLWNVGEEADFMFMGKSGRNIHLYRAQLLVEIITPGTMVGYLPMFVNRRRESRCAVSDDDDGDDEGEEGDCTVLRLDRADYLRLKTNHPKAAEALVTACFDRTNTEYNHLIQVSYTQLSVVYYTLIMIPTFSPVLQSCTACL